MRDDTKTEFADDEARMAFRADADGVGVWISVLAPLAIAALILFPYLGRRGHLDGHETLVAQTAREMVESGDWIAPTFAGEPRYQKPPLAYWLAAASFLGVGGASEFTARLPVALATLAGVGLIAWLATQLFGPRIGILAGMAHATTYWTIAFGKSAQVDGVLTTLVAGAIALSAYDRYRDARLPTSIAVLGWWTLSALAVLAKGPVALAIIVPTTLLYRILRRRAPADRPFFLHLSTTLGAVAFVAIAAPWPALTLLREPATAELWFSQSAGRFWSHWGPSHRPWFYYLYETPVLTAPWSLAWMAELLAIAHDIRRRKRLDDARLLFALWFGVALAFFTLSAGKRDHYILPGLPPLSVLTALGLSRLQVAVAPWLHHRARTAKWGLVAASAIAGLAGVGATIAWRLPALTPIAIRLPFAVALCGVFFVDWTLAPRRRTAAARVFLAFAWMALVIETQLMPALYWRENALAMFSRNREALASAELVIQFESNDRWAIFPIDRPMRWARSPDELQRWLAEKGSALVLAPRRRLADMPSSIAYSMIDQSPAERSFAERDPNLDLLLLRATWKSPSLSAMR